MKKNLPIKAFIMLLCILTVKLNAQLSGTVTINSANATGGTNYQSFNALASALTSNGISGPLTVNVVTGSGPYNEQVVFSQITGMSSTNTITINGNGNLLTFNGSSSAPYTIVLNGTDNLFINNLQMQGTNTTYAMVCILTNNANYNTFTSCSFSCTPNATSSYAIPWAVSNSMTFPSSGGSANFNTVITSTLYSGYYSVYHFGLSSAPYTTDNSFIGCRITDFYVYCVYSYYAKNLTFRGCEFDRMTRTSFTTTYMMYGFYMQGLIFEQNTIHDLYNMNQTYTGSFQGFYYVGYYNPDPSNRNIFRNNIVRDIKFNGTQYWFNWNYNSSTDWLHNTFSLDNTAATGGSIYIWYYCYGLAGTTNNFHNNNISISQGGSGTKYAMYFGGNTGGTNINGNNYYITATNGYVGYYTGNATTLSQWQSQGPDVVGYDLNPMYANLATGDLHPTNTALNNKGLPMGVPVDNLNMPREQLTPDIGALEFLSVQCSGTPSANSIVTPTFMLCPGEKAVLNVANYTSDLGVTYQWLTSPTSTLGPWTQIPGANSIYYTTPNLSSNTIYGVAITCTNAAGSTTAAGIVNIAGVTTSVVPYYESFESIPSPNKLPNCSWFSPDLGSTALTYTSSNTLGRVARTGTKFASFVYNPAGAKYFYTNAIQLEPGITYSASVWFQTEYYGYNNWSDLSIMLGPNQSTTGLVTIASTNGPAISNVYKSLSNTFTVATSGLYYVAVRGTGNTSGSAQYLSWDDLAIEIPCSLNSPTMNVTATSTSICQGQSVNLTATGADDYTWSTGDIGSNVAPVLPGVGMNNISVIGTNTLTGCTTIVNQMIQVNPSPNIFVVSDKAAVCSGQPANLTAFGAATYSWSIGGNSPMLVVMPTANTTYTVLGSNSYGCTSTGVVSVNVNPLPTILASSDRQTLCVGESVVLTANGGVNYSWLSNAQFQQIGNPINAAPTTSGSYTVTGTDANGCASTAIVSLGVDACVGINKHISDKNLVVYPNPTSGLLTVEVNNAANKLIEVTDLTGRVVATVTTTDEKVSLNLDKLANGIYNLNIHTGTSVEVVKIVKE
jgi:hypothetical protein